MSVLKYEVGDESYYIQNPTEVQIVNQILALDNNVYYGCKFAIVDYEWIQAVGGYEDRVMVEFVSSRTKPYYLRDSDVLHSSGIIPITIVSQTSEQPIWITVYKKTAIQAFTYYNRTGKLDQTLHWYGRNTSELEGDADVFGR